MRYQQPWKENTCTVYRYTLLLIGTLTATATRIYFLPLHKNQDFKGKIKTIILFHNKLQAIFTANVKTNQQNKN